MTINTNTDTDTITNSSNIKPDEDALKKQFSFVYEIMGVLNVPANTQEEIIRQLLAAIEVVAFDHIMESFSEEVKAEFKEFFDKTTPFEKLKERLPEVQKYIEQNVKPENLIIFYSRATTETLDLLLEDLSQEATDEQAIRIKQILVLHNTVNLSK